MKQKQADKSSACFCRYDHSRVIRNGMNVHNDKLRIPHKIRAFGIRQTNITPLNSHNRPANWNLSLNRLDFFQIYCHVYCVYGSQKVVLEDTSTKKRPSNCVSFDLRAAYQARSSPTKTNATSLFISITYFYKKSRHFRTCIFKYGIDLGWPEAQYLSRCFF